MMGFFDFFGAGKSSTKQEGKKDEPWRSSTEKNHDHRDNRGLNRTPAQKGGDKKRRK
ncbi:hypothetical protein [Massilia alkalitolerans]|uniref:hypothetical protein n=1 Tax=Massilia alkalitolerans TaxID=286638 RepID=UPI001B7FEA88|nr:hypothetical protein [Massilia alkalitolerans]